MSARWLRWNREREVAFQRARASRMLARTPAGYPKFMY